MRVIDTLDAKSIKRLQVWCFAEALRTQDREAFHHWWELWDARKKEKNK